MATPLKRVRGLGAAHRGTETFWRQRVTAIANIPLVIFLILSVVSHIGAPYAQVKAYLAQPVVAVLFVALIVSAAIHMRIGLKEIIDDYVHSRSKVLCILGATFFAGFVCNGGPSGAFQGALQGVRCGNGVVDVISGEQCDVAIHPCCDTQNFSCQFAPPGAFTIP